MKSGSPPSDESTDPTGRGAASASGRRFWRSLQVAEHLRLFKWESPRSPEGEGASAISVRSVFLIESG